MTPELGQFIGKYADVDLEAGVENVKDRMDREFRERQRRIRRAVDD